MIPLILLNLAGPLKEKKLSENIDIICLHNLIYLKYSVLDLTNFRTKGITIRNKTIFEGQFTKKKTECMNKCILLRTFSYSIQYLIMKYSQFSTDTT